MSSIVFSESLQDSFLKFTLGLVEVCVHIGSSCSFSITNKPLTAAEISASVLCSNNRTFLLLVFFSIQSKTIKPMKFSHNTTQHNVLLFPPVEFLACTAGAALRC